MRGAARAKMAPGPAFRPMVSTRCLPTLHILQGLNSRAFWVAGDALCAALGLPRAARRDQVPALLLGDVGELVHLGAAGAALVEGQHLVPGEADGDVVDTDRGEEQETDQKLCAEPRGLRRRSTT